MELVVRTSSVGGRTVLGVVGEIDLATIPLLHSALIRAINERSTLIVDLDGTYACDDTGLGVLLGAAGRAREAGGELTVVCAEGAFRNRLARTGFDRAITVTASIAEAVAQPQATGER